MGRTKRIGGLSQRQKRIWMTRLAWGAMLLAIAFVALAPARFAVAPEAPAGVAGAV